MKKEIVSLVKSFVPRRTADYVLWSALLASPLSFPLLRAMDNNLCYSVQTTEVVSPGIEHVVEKVLEPLPSPEKEPERMSPSQKVYSLHSLHQDLYGTSHTKQVFITFIKEYFQRLPQENNRLSFTFRHRRTTFYA